MTIANKIDTDIRIALELIADAIQRLSRIHEELRESGEYEEKVLPDLGDALHDLEAARRVLEG